MIEQVRQKPKDRMNALREYVPNARSKDWKLERAGQRVQVIKKDEKELSSYYSAIAQGVEPISTKQKDIDAAVAISNETGKAFDGANPTASYFN